MAPPQVTMLSILSLVSEDETRLDRDVSSMVAELRTAQRQHPDKCPIHTPLRVYQRGDQYPIIAGNTRYFAALQIGLKALPCIVEDEPADPARLLIELVKDNELHRPYTPLERARNVLRLVELKGCTQGEAARLLGIGESDGAKAVSVLKRFPADLHALIGDGEGKVPFTCAYVLSRVPDEAKVRELADKIVKGLMTRDRLEPVVATLLGKKAKKEKPVTVREEGAKIELPGEWGWPKLAAFARKLTDVATKGEKHTLPFSALQQLLKT
jgi:ParB-like chromosome segregation protein Spo0J